MDLVEKIIGSGKKTIPIGEETTIVGHFIPSKVLEKQSLNLGNVVDIRNELFNIYKDKGLISKEYNYTFTDKSLDNFFYLNLIKEIYPNAKIINCKRDSLSSIMSIFQNNLTALAWTHDLDNIFKYFDCKTGFRMDSRSISILSNTICLSLLYILSIIARIVSLDVAILPFNQDCNRPCSFISSCTRPSSSCNSLAMFRAS